MVSLRTRAARTISPAPMRLPRPGAMPKMRLATAAVIVSGMNRVSE